MKRFLLCFIVIGLCCVYSSYAQERTEETVTTVDSTGNESTVQVVRISKTEDLRRNKNLIGLNPFKFLFLYHLSYFRSISPAVAVGGTVQIPSLAEMVGVGGLAEVRFYLSSRNLHGFYLAPNISYTSITVDDEVDLSWYSAGGLVGWQWFPGDDFAVGLGVGVDYYELTASDSDEDIGVYEIFNGMMPAFRVDIGYGWE